MSSIQKGIVDETDAIKGADGKRCWKGKRYAGTKNGKDKCIPVKNEAANPAQQAAIAVNMKKKGKKPKKVTESIITEGKILVEGRIVRKLWESAGQKLVEAQLTQQQIEQIFKSAEEGMTAGGANRTFAGKGKDAASAVNRAWEDLKTKIQNSGPIQNMDAMYDKAAEQLKAATGGDQGAMSYVQKYRDFAKKHPIAQSFLYAALIAAAGLSGAGAGGAAALGLLKMTDKLLQGEKFSSAAYSGAKTGGLAYAAGQIGQQMKGAGAQPAQPASNPDDIFNLKPGTPEFDKEQASQMHDIMWQQQQGAGVPKASLPAGDPNFKDFSSMVDPNQASLPDGDPSFKDFSSMVEPEQATGTAKSAAKAAGGEAWKSVPFEKNDILNSVAKEIRGQVVDMDPNGAWAKLANGKIVDPDFPFDAASNNDAIAAYQLTVTESRLSKRQIFAILSEAARQQTMLNEGIMDTVKGAVGKVGQWAKTKGHNITTKITADKLMQAWKNAGSPTDSEAVREVLLDAGVSEDVVSSLIPDSNAQAPDAETPAATQAAGAAQAPAKAGQALGAQPAKAGQATPNATPTVKDIKAAIVNMKMRDLQSLVKMVDAIIASKAKSPAAPATAMDEGVIVGHDKDDPEVAVLGGAGTMSLSRLKKKAKAEADMLANDLAKGAFKAAAYNIKQLENTLATIKAAEAEMEKLYFGEDYTGEFAAEKTPAINPYGGLKDKQHRGAIGEALLSEMPTDNPTGASGEGGWRKYKPKSAGTFAEDTAYAGGMGQGGNAGESYRKFKPKSAGTFKEEEQLDEKCWDGYKQVGMKKKGGKTVPNCVAKESSIMKGITGRK